MKETEVPCYVWVTCYVCWQEFRIDDNGSVTVPDHPHKGDTADPDAPSLRCPGSGMPPVLVSSY